MLKYALDFPQKVNGEVLFADVQPRRSGGGVVCLRHGLDVWSQG